MQEEKAEEVEMLEKKNEEGGDGAETILSLHEVFTYVPEFEHGTSRPPQMPSIPEIVIKKSCFTAITVKLLCSAIEAELYQLVYSEDSMLTLKKCMVAVNPKGQGSTLKASDFPSGMRLYFGGTVSSVPSANCWVICVGNLVALTLPTKMTK